MTLLVVVGAGASYDSVPSRPPQKHDGSPPRPPLANDLFQARHEFLAALRTFPPVGEIAAQVQAGIGGRTVEDLLTEYATEADQFGRRKVQLIALRYYLREIIAAAEGAWYTNNPVPLNLTLLLPEIDRLRGDGAQPLLVTFNYDCLIERALKIRGRRFDSFDDYLSTTDPPLIKLHGSIDWLRSVHPQAPTSHMSAAQMAEFVCERIDTLPLDGDFLMASGNHSEGDDPSHHISIPAIAVPVTNKDEFECPLSHIQFLERALPAVRRILTIGWRGRETHFLQMLRARLGPKVRTLCVAGNRDEAVETANHLAVEVPQIEATPFDGKGFTLFMQSRVLRDFAPDAWSESKP